MEVILATMLVSSQDGTQATAAAVALFLTPGEPERRPLGTLSPGGDELFQPR
jgi:hypothetical protein